MVDSVASIAMDKLVEETKERNSLQDEKKKKEKLARKLEVLETQRATLDPALAEELGQEAGALYRMADYTKYIADKLEKDKKQLEKKKLKEIKEVLMDKLGVPAEFVEQLSVLVKAGPEALREASAVYKKEGDKKRDQAALMRDQLKTLDAEIKQIEHVKGLLVNKQGSKKETMKDFINRKFYEDAIRDKSELEYKQALELMEGENLASKL